MTDPRRGMRLKAGARRAAAATFVVAAVAIAALLAAPAAGAATAGAALIVRPGTTTPLSGGGSATEYGVVLPSGAACPGDTAHDGYHVYSYLVPAGHLPTQVSYRTEFPGRWYGYISEGAYFGAINTAEGTGQVVQLPIFTWTRLTPKELFAQGTTSAVWEGGIACVNERGQVTEYWNSTIRFTADGADPGGFTWKVLAQHPIPAPFDPAPLIGVGLLVVAAGAAAYALALHRARRRDRTSPPEAGSADRGGAASAQTREPEQALR